MNSKGLQELILPAAVVVIAGLMIFPLPPAALDILLAVNIGFSLILLLTSVYTEEPEKFTSLPSLLLLTTIFRLGLNVSTTRQLLTYGEAPRVVSAFGEFVVNGNVLVGAVVFLIVTLVQFIVVSKGAERVAEVAARFTLDAMPGKQMAIDADIRAGILSISEAKDRRRELQRESKLFGALDGAMKFIKGDAIAGICIAVLNISAGFVIGVCQLGLTFREALDRYTIFTIGDSLASQVPALFVSVAAGIAVTRVGESGGVSMARELVGQLTEEPKVLLCTSVVLAALALSPGVPGAPFLLLAVGSWLLAGERRRQNTARGDSVSSLSFEPRAGARLLLRFGEDARNQLLAEGALAPEITRARKEVYEGTGIIIPEPEWEIAAELPPKRIGVVCEGVLLAEDDLGSSAVVTAAHPLSSFVAALFGRCCREHIELLIDDTQTRMLLDLHLGGAEDLITSLIPKQIAITTLSRVLRDLAGEGVSVRNIRGVLQGIAEFVLMHGPVDSPLSEKKYLGLLAAVRASLRRQIVAGLEREEGIIRVWELAPQRDHLLVQAVSSSTPLTPRFVAALIESLRAAASENRPIIVMCSAYARRAMVQIARAGGVPLTAVSPEEFPDDETVRIVGRIGAEDAEMGGDSSTAMPPLRAAAASPDLAQGELRRVA